VHLSSSKRKISKKKKEQRGGTPGERWGHLMGSLRKVNETSILGESGKPKAENSKSHSKGIFEAGIGGIRNIKESEEVGMKEVSGIRRGKKIQGGESSREADSQTTSPAVALGRRTQQGKAGKRGGSQKDII